MKIASINGLRGLAIIAVIFHHSFYTAFAYGKGSSQLPLIVQNIFSSGWLGVNLFFMLSGVVLFLPYARQTRHLSSASDAFSFYKHRFHRLMPLYWFACFVTLVFATNFRLDDPRFYDWLVRFALVTFPFSQQTFFPVSNGILWSIGIEIWFSALFPLLIFLVHRFGWKPFLVAVFLLSFATRLAGQILLCQVDYGLILNSISDSVLGRLDDFVLGMLLAHLITRPESHRLFTLTNMLIGVLGIVFTTELWGTWLGKGLPSWSASLFSLPLNLSLFFVIGYLATPAKTGRTVIRSFFENRLFQMLGMMCYSLYVWHALIKLRFNSSYIIGVSEYLAYLTTVLIISSLTYRYIEFGKERNIKYLLPTRQQNS